MMGHWATVATPLDHYVLPPRIRFDETSPTLVLLHGRGSTAKDLLPISQTLRNQNFLVLAAQAPYRLAAPFGTGYAWYHIDHFGEPEPRSLDASSKQLQRFLEAAVDRYTIDTQRMFILGFSQGAVMALGVGTKNPSCFGGVVALSGYLPATLVPTCGLNLQKLAVFLGHGTTDMIVPVAAGRKARDTLVARGVDISYREYHAGHQVTPIEVEHVSRWLSNRLDQIPPD